MVDLLLFQTKIKFVLCVWGRHLILFGLNIQCIRVSLSREAK